MANEEVMNEMDMENEGTLITLEDEEGNEVEFEFLDIVEYDGEEYIVPTRKPRNMSASRTRTCSTSCSTSSRKSTRAKSTLNKA